MLTSGTHTFKLRVTGTKNPSSSNTWVVPDRVDITASTVTVDDATIGTGQNQFNYSASGWNHTNCNSGDGCYNGTNSWNNATDQYVTVTFTGTQINLYGLKDTTHG